MRGLTRTGRQVSEDPDLDNLLSMLSPEEMEELEKDMVKVPDLKPEDGKIIVQGESQQAQPPTPTNNNVPDTKQDRRLEGDAKQRLSQKEPSFEVCKYLTWLLTRLSLKLIGKKQSFKYYLCFSRPFIPFGICIWTVLNKNDLQMGDLIRVYKIN